MNSSAEPRLAAPGAGLPKVELWIARLIFAIRRRRGNRDSFNVDFQRERAAIRTRVQLCDREAAAHRVLIPRVRGMEDSSRHWSVWMTLDHLRIVHGQIGRTISALAKGIVPSGKASTAAVKPDPRVTAEVATEYEQSCDDLMATVGLVRDLRTTARFAHPWFGPLDAAGWHALAAGHLAIHCRQIERIVGALARV